LIRFTTTTLAETNRESLGLNPEESFDNKVVSDVHLLAEVDDFPADNLKLLSYMPMNLQKRTLIDEPVEGK
jgi:hypothetical protein